METPPKEYTSIDANRFSNLESRVVHLDTIVGTVMQNQAAMQSTLDAIGESVGKITERVNQPTTTNYIGLVSAVVALVLVMSQGVSMRVGPIEHAVDKITSAMALDDIREQKNERTDGELVANISALEARVTKVEANKLLIDASIIKLTESSARNHIAVIALGKGTQTVLDLHRVPDHVP